MIMCRSLKRKVKTNLKQKKNVTKNRKLIRQKTSIRTCHENWSLIKQYFKKILERRSKNLYISNSLRVALYIKRNPDINQKVNNSASVNCFINFFKKLKSRDQNIIFFLILPLSVFVRNEILAIF